LMASVLLRVKITSRDGAPMKRASRARASS
jgi:hypothetical protein